ncbi:class I SAM-dependent methyltransferase [Aporhodopirellula aestuarii]|uniref:Class I SAM-dependent methyltransferase n=1 Tax=Aporhodopirellula aestuarii TaxID=2950107 RepID=A0ABT0U662_9BACT|nr:class I SAM-dependent methyltransferase [Aporhodopirellula aestuarii]MCM2372025.1 class I SAM-dependent methyltransferase [Aporhodopirellula aestuarii]
MLQPISLPRNLDARPIPTTIHAMVHDLRCRIEAFQDRWDVPQIEQFVAADYELVYQTLDWLRESQMMIGNRFLEWGCGFAAVTLIADSLGWDCIGIESESTLLTHGHQTVADWCQTLRSNDDVTSNHTATLSAVPELVRGNFLPTGSESLADDPTLPSLGHDTENAYRKLGLELDDFAVVYSYPWPGEDEFHELVFDRHAARGAILVQFCGPNDVRAWRAVSNP